MPLAFDSIAARPEVRVGSAVCLSLTMEFRPFVIRHSSVTVESGRPSTCCHLTLLETNDRLSARVGKKS